MTRVNYRAFFVLIFASLALFLIDRNGLFYWPKYAVQIVVNPIEYGLYSIKVGASDSVSFLSFWRSGEERIKNLEQKNWELTSKLVLMKEIQEENNFLRAQLGAKPMGVAKMLPARVLGQGQGLEINVGEQDGAKPGMSVTLAGNLIGRVERVLPRSAFVVLPRDGQSKIPVAIGTVRAVAMGAYGSEIILDKVGQTDQLQKDDLVVTSGEGESYVAGLVVGRISNITGKETDLFRRAEVVPLINYDKLRTVFLVIN